MFFGLFKRKPAEAVPHADATSAYKASSAAPEYVKQYEDAGGKPSVSTYYTAYSSSDLVNSCVSYIAETGGLTRFKIRQKDKSGKLLPLKNKKVRALFENAPNSFFTWQELIEQSIQSYLLTGNTFLSFEAIAEYELWLLESSKMKIVPDPNEYVSGYIYNDKISFTPTECVHFRRASSNNLYYGTSAVMQCIADSLILEGYATEDLKEFYENSSVGDGVLSSELPLTKKQIESIKEQFEANYSKDGKRHSTIILPSKLGYTNIKLSPKDSMLLDSLNISSDRILRTFRLHKVVLGGEVDSYSNKMDTIATLVFNTAIKPIVEKIAAQLQLFFRKVLKTDNLYISCDYDNIPYMSNILEDKAVAVTKLTASGILSFNEGRDAVGLAPIDNPNFDKHWLPAYLVSGNAQSVEDFDPNKQVSNKPVSPTTVDPTGGTNLNNGG